MISVKEKRYFGREILIGTSIVNSLLQYSQPEEAYLEDIQPVGGGDWTEAPEEEGEGEEGGIDNAAFEGDEKAPSKAGSMAGSKAGSNVASKARSIVGSKAASIAASFKSVSFAPAGLNEMGSGIKTPSARSGKSILKTPSRVGSKAPSRMASQAASRASRASRAPSKAASKIQSLLATPSRRSQAGSYAPSILPTPSRMSLGKLEHSSTIHHHVRSKPSSGRKTPLRKISTPVRGSGSTSGSLQNQSPGNKSQKAITPRLSITGSQPVTPFKKLMSQKGTPEAAPLLENEELMVEGGGGNEPPASDKKSLIEQIATPIRSIGSKLATPLQSFKKSATGGSAEKLNSQDPEDIELQMGAEASDFYDDVSSQN